jgi:protein-S-isoprenylcysteine O-methyltransferase Ste14
MREWWALNSDPQFINWVVLLMLADLTVLLDYGHWRFAPSLQRPFLQALGLALYVGVAICQMWTDAYLAGHLSKGQPEPLPMHQGPYRFVRHPRYVAAIIGKVAFALIFASLLGWIMVLAWGAFLLRKIEIEEAHLRTLFGRGYEAYQQKTAKVLPGIY